MVVVQRVRLRWTASDRAADRANARRAVPDAFDLPPLPTGSVVIHDVLADVRDGYRPAATILAGADAAARHLWLWIEVRADTVSVDRLPGYAAYPTRSGPARLFTLADGQFARYRANFRFTGGSCSPHWSYEQWTIHIANTPQPAPFRNAHYAHDIDERVHLYGRPRHR